jgi:hypothetical protein
MIDLVERFPAPPPVSPSARPALGVALAMNMLLAAGLHLGMSFAVSTKVSEELTVAAMQAAPVIYLALLLPIVATYGIAAAAWTGWSWWRVPLATLCGSILALGVNAWLMSEWIARQGWQVNPLLSTSDPRINHLLILSVLSAIMLIGIGLTMFKRWAK